MGSVKVVKLQLAITDDLKNSVTILETKNSELLKSISNYEAAYKAMKQAAASGSQTKDAQGKYQVTADQKAKELGISANSIPGYQESEKAWQKLDSTIDKINEY